MLWQNSVFQVEVDYLVVHYQWALLDYMLMTLKLVFLKLKMEVKLVGFQAADLLHARELASQLTLLFIPLPLLLFLQTI